MLLNAPHKEYASACNILLTIFCSVGVALARRVPPRAALEMLLTGDAITSARAAEIGLINRVVYHFSLANK